MIVKLNNKTRRPNSSTEKESSQLQVASRLKILFLLLTILRVESFDGHEGDCSRAHLLVIISESNSICGVFGKP